MPYIIYEKQLLNGRLVPVEPAPTRTDKNEAFSVFYQKMAAAASSSVPVHSVTMEDETGLQLARGCFTHGQEEA